MNIISNGTNKIVNHLKERSEKTASLHHFSARSHNMNKTMRNNHIQIQEHFIEEPACNTQNVKVMTVKESKELF